MDNDAKKIVVISFLTTPLFIIIFLTSLGYFSKENTIFIIGGFISLFISGLIVSAFENGFIPLKEEDGDNKNDWCYSILMVFLLTFIFIFIDYLIVFKFIFS